jgi:hypothetical protein
MQKRKKPGRSFPWREFVGSPTAWLALFVSLGSAYYSIFYYVDDIRVSVDSAPSLFFHKDTESILISEPKHATFINAGTRASVITHMEINFNQPDDKGVDLICRRGGIWRSGNLLFTPTVLKSGEIISFQLKYSDLQSPFKEISAGRFDDRIDVQGQNANEQNAQLIVYVCLKFTIINPSGVSDQITRYISKSTIDRRSHYTASGMTQYMYDISKPIPLIYANPFGSTSYPD